MINTHPASRRRLGPAYTRSIELRVWLSSDAGYCGVLDTRREAVSNLSPEIVIVGGGVGGGTLATVLARNGIGVVVVERETAYPDRVRGEFVAPWGVAEFKRLGLLELLYAHGAMHTKRNVPYDENWSSEQAERRALDLTKLHP